MNHLPKSLTALVLAIGIVLASSMHLAQVFADVEKPVFPKAEGEQCVADTNLMRREHMDLMTHQRDETVIQGIRGNPYSIVGCVDCHAQKDSSGKAVRVDAEGQFCQSCHAYTAVKIDCFGCHAAVPSPVKKTVSLPWSNLYSSLKTPTHPLGQLKGQRKKGQFQRQSLAHTPGQAHGQYEYADSKP